MENAHQNVRVLPILKFQFCRIFCTRHKVFVILTKSFRNHNKFSVKYTEPLAMQSLLIQCNVVIQCKDCNQVIYWHIYCLWRETEKFCQSHESSYDTV